MKVKVKGKIEKEVIVKKGIVKEVLEKLKISENDVLISLDGDLLVSSAVVKEGDVIELIDVVSGG
tara:strand:- start:243 stop:437 length:195 start_codon:yes stop_codon:yes gene_type:complete